MTAYLPDGSPLYLDVEFAQAHGIQAGDVLTPRLVLHLLVYELMQAIEARVEVN